MQNIVADAVWQSLFFEPQTLVHIWWVIPLGLLVEWPAVRKMTAFSCMKSLWVTVCMNAFSFFVGIVLQSPAMFMRGLIGFVAILVLMILGSTFLEGFIINHFQKKAFNRRTFPLLLLVNVISGGITIAVVLHWA